MKDDFSRRVLLSLDAESYSQRNDVQQHLLQEGLVAVITEAAARSGLDRSQWEIQPAGDGELAVLPPQVSEREVLDELVPALVHELSNHNAGRGDDGRLRLRFGLHQGLVGRTATGYPGQGVVTVSRLVDSAPSRRALAVCRAAQLVVIVSPSVFNEFVAQRHTRLLVADFRKVRVRNKTFHDAAWLTVPGHDVHALDLDEAPDDATPAVDDRRVPAPSGSPQHPDAQVVTNHIGRVRGKQHTFGFNYNYNDR